jgi:hypothetical protein
VFEAGEILKCNLRANLSEKNSQLTQAPFSKIAYVPQKEEPAAADDGGPSCNCYKLILSPAQNQALSTKNGTSS